VSVQPKVEFAALKARTITGDPQLLVGHTIRAIDWPDQSDEAIFELTDGRRFVVRAHALSDGPVVLALGAGADAEALACLVARRKD
jgi:hypothetical protein